MRRTLTLLGATLWAVSAAADEHRVFTRGAAAEERVRRVCDTVSWTNDLDRALDRARTEGKPVLWLQLVGNLDGDA
jgi:hypothetical protein